MSKVAFEVWVLDMEDKLLLATKEGQTEEIVILADAEAWALDLSDNANVKYAFVMERRKIRTYDGKGLLIKRAQEAKDGKKRNVQRAEEDETFPPSPTGEPEEA